MLEIDTLFSFFSENNFLIVILTMKPDHELVLTSVGEQQALEAGKEIFELTNDESVYVYLSPYRRGLQILEGIHKSLKQSQIITVRQDPRLREQEFGNFADLSIRESEVAASRQIFLSSSYG
jgi:broad specificity phosphatase PhoE